MATCNETVTEALNELGVIGEGEAATAAMLANAMPVLQSLYNALVTAGTFGRATDALIDADHTMEEGERVFSSADANLVITLPENVTDADVYEDRPIRDYSLARIAGNPAQTYIYSAPLGAWQKMTSLADSDFAPLSERDFYGLACMLALRLARRYGATPGDTTIAAANGFRSSLAAKADAPSVPSQPEYF